MDASFRGRSILIVDDSVEDVAAVRRLLMNRDGAVSRVRVATTGAEGLAVCRAEPPDCLLLDFDLPDVDGLKFLAGLRSSEGGASIAVVMLTGRGGEGVAVEAMKAGAQDYLVKGRISAEVLLHAVDDAIDRVATLRELERLHAEAREAGRQKDAAIARLEEVEARLRNQLDLIGTVARTTAEGLCMVDARGCPTFMNPAAEQILGRTHDELRDTPLLGLFHPDPRGLAGRGEGGSRCGKPSTRG